MALLHVLVSLLPLLVYGGVVDRYYHHGEKRIVNGRNARIGGFPWQVSMFLDGNLICGGTLITLNHVMTAAHCFKDGKTLLPFDKYRVVLGKYDMEVQETDKRVRSISSVELHEDYQLKDIHANDIAIVTLATPVKQSTRIYPGCLPHKELPDGKECFITGWGKTYAWGDPARVLQELKTKIVGIDECRKRNERGDAKVMVSNLCTGDENEYSSGCRGDSGGPLSCLDPDTYEWKVYGVVSWGDRQCNGLSKYTVYTKVISYLPWINEITEDGLLKECFRADP